ncbi:hypothetical protein Leryth_000355 [Lithospermum erythrorhizon]|nr:hypothetical protein Leryth_000355 [Lithospermum erythrorhizon]
MFGTRLGKQCRERWVNHLCSDIKKDYWSEEEEKMLILAHKRLGTSWADIAKEISGRPENSIKNHWYATKRKLCSSKKGKSRRPWTNPKIKSTLLLEYINEYHKEETSHNLECPPPSTNIPTSIDTHSSMPTLAETFPNPASIDDCSYPTDSVFSRIYHEMMLIDDEFSFVESFYNDYHHSSSSDDIDNIMVGQEGLDAPREGMV